MSHKQVSTERSPCKGIDYSAVIHALLLSFILFIFSCIYITVFNRRDV